MCRRLILVFWMIVITLSVFGQEKPYSVPDYNEIERLTNDKSSVFYYNRLYKRYAANDTTLDLRDYRMLYYGHFFQPGFSPFSHTPESDSIKMLLGANDALSSDAWNEIIRLGNANISKNPFDLKGLNMVWIAYRQTGDSVTARLYFDKLKKLVQTILATGDGLSEASAFHVVNVSHEYDILNILGYEFGGNQRLTNNHCDYLSLKTNNDDLPGLYFNVKQIFKGYEKSLSGTVSR